MNRLLFGIFVVLVNSLYSQAPSNDDYINAIDVTSLIYSCSSDAQFTNVNATSDLNEASCLNTTGTDPDFNVWFKFTAPANGNVEATIDIGGTKGSATRINAAIWESNGTTEVSCSRYSANGNDVSVGSVDLTPGSVYYLSVDNQNYNRRGTFTLCFDKLDTTYYSRGDGDWDDPNTWSLSSHSGSAATYYPQVGDYLYIQGSDITIDADARADSIVVNIADEQTSLTIDNSNLTLSNSIHLVNVGNDFNGFITLQNGAVVNASGDLTMTRAGGRNMFRTYVATSCSLNVANMNMISSAGTINESMISLDAGYASVSGNINLTNTGGILNKIQLDKASQCCSKTTSFTLPLKFVLQPIVSL